MPYYKGIYTCIPETNHVPREHRVAAILVLLFMVLISLVPALTPLYLYVSTFPSMCAVPNMAVLSNYYYYYYYYYYYHHHHHRYLLYAGYLHLYSRDKPCP